MLAKTFSAVLHHGQLQIIEVEVDARRGIPQLIVIGLASQALHEARERLLSALHNCGVHHKSKRTIINLAPAELKKTSARLDLAMAVGLLQVAQVIPPITKKVAWLGELALDGSIKTSLDCAALIPRLIAAGFDEIVVPTGTATTFSGIRSISHLKELLALKSIADLATLAPITRTQPPVSDILFEQIIGQHIAKRALALAIAGKHHCLLAGPPGTGKTLLLTTAAQLYQQHYPESPIRQPHHSISVQGMVGGGLRGEPGEASLADRGVLILDELAEFNRSSLESLREPLSHRKVLISRGEYHYAYPAHFVLLATMNRCPCGLLGSSNQLCRCSPTEISRYHQRVSGALHDRIDMHVLLHNQAFTVQKVASVTRSQISAAIKMQLQRYHDTALESNSDLELPTYQKYAQFSSAATALITTIAAEQHSLRRLQKIIALSQTSADLDGTTHVQVKNVLEAISFQSTMATSNELPTRW